MDPLFCLRVYQFSTVFSAGTNRPISGLLLQTIYFSSKQFDMLLLPLENVLSLVALIPSPFIGHIALVPNLVGSIKLSYYCGEKFLYQSITQPTRFRMGNRPSVLDLVFTKFPNIVSAIKYWHLWGIVITHYYPSHVVFLIHTSPHVRELNGATMSE